MFYKHPFFANKNTVKLSILGLLAIAGMSLLVILATVDVKQSPLPTPSITATPQVAADRTFPEVAHALLREFPSFPVYPGAILEASAKVDSEMQSDTGYRAKWEVARGNVPQLMRWYETELKQRGWEVTPSNDPAAQGEQIAHLKHGTISGYIAVEDEGSTIEIVADLRRR